MPTRLRLIGLLACACLVGEAHATFHFMQIEQVVAGVGGDPASQAIQLRMRSSFQNLVSQARLIVRDAGGANPVLLVDFAANAANQGIGLRILAITPGMANRTTPPAAADFTLTGSIPPSYLAAGSLTFEDNFGTVYWRLSWGDYRGPTTGAITNDADGQFGPPFGSSLPTWDQGLLFQGAATAPSTSNLADYALTAGAAVLTNNAGASFTVNLPTDAAPVFLMEPLSNMPNPFNPSTAIVFTRQRPSTVSLRIYDLQGRLVATLVEGPIPAGTHRITWDGRDHRGQRLATGAYVARLSTPERVETRKVLLIQ